MADKQKTVMEEFLEDAAGFDDELESDELNDARTEEPGEADSSEIAADESNKANLEELEAVTGSADPTGPEPTPVQTEALDPAAGQEAPQTPATEPAAATEPAQPVVAAPAEPASPAAAAPAPVSTENIQEVFTDWRKQTEDLLAQHHYALSEEDMARLDTEPQEFIPRLAARIYLDAVSAAISQVVNYLPRMVRQVNEQDAVNSQSENAFFERWPDLKQHQQKVIAIGQTYRQMNPQATAEQFINEVGAAAMVSLRLDPAGKTPAAPATQQPFVPAAQTPQGGVPKPVKPTNIFSQLDEEFSVEEDID